MAVCRSRRFRTTKNVANGQKVAMLGLVLTIYKVTDL